MSPDWSAKVEPVPYAKLGDPQSLNLYGYMLDSPLDGVDQDGHCKGPNCDRVTVNYKLQKKPNVVVQTVHTEHGIKAETGPLGKLTGTVKVDGKPVSGVKVNESNTYKLTENGKPQASVMQQGSATTQKGQYSDTLSATLDVSENTTAVAAAMKTFTNNTWTVKDNQTLSLTFPSGKVCTATSVRTLTNGGPSGQYQIIVNQQPIVNP